MNQSTKTSKISAVFLAAVLTAGMIALSSPSFMTGAEAFPYKNNHNDHEDKFKFKPSFGKSFGKSTSASFKCTNINLNFPGLDFSPTFPSNGDGDNGEVGATSFGERNGQNNGGHNGFKSFDKDGVIGICINANDNSVRGGIDGEEPEPEPTTCPGCFTTVLSQEELDDLIQAIDEDSGGDVDSLQELCAFIANSVAIEDEEIRELQLAFISERLFTLGAQEGISEDKINELLDCLERIFEVDFPRELNGGNSLLQSPQTNWNI